MGCCRLRSGNWVLGRLPSSSDGDLGLLAGQVAMGPTVVVPSQRILHRCISGVLRQPAPERSPDEPAAHRLYLLRRRLGLGCRAISGRLERLPRTSGRFRSKRLARWLNSGVARQNSTRGAVCPCTPGSPDRSGTCGCIPVMPNLRRARSSDTSGLRRRCAQCRAHHKRVSC